MVRDHQEIFKDARILREMLTFIKNPKTGKKEAQEGKHDDLVIASAITYFIAEQMAAIWEEPIIEPKKDFITRNFNSKPAEKGGIVEW